MALPYRWHPCGAKVTRDRPAVGALWPHEHRVYRVVQTQEIPEELWDARASQYLEALAPEWRRKLNPFRMVVRPVETPTTGDPRDRDADLVVGVQPWVSTLAFYPDEHYPICATCYEPLPCREQMAEVVAAGSARRMGRYETPGICPSCAEPVTARQESRTFADNLEVIGGPPVTFHLRRKCRGSAVQYETRWVAEDPDHRRAVWTCTGRVLNHNDGTYECSAGNRCSGPRAGHSAYTCCSCLDCHVRGTFHCEPSPDARRRTAAPELSRGDVA